MVVKVELEDEGTTARCAARVPASFPRPPLAVDRRRSRLERIAGLQGRAPARCRSIAADTRRCRWSRFLTSQVRRPTRAGRVQIQAHARARKAMNGPTFSPVR